MSKKNVLGRGLDALITMDDAEPQGSTSINEVLLSQIHPNPDQPRRMFDEEALEELSTSIKKIGVIQPITLRQTSSDSYQIIAGERRYRASLMAGLESIPAYVKSVNDSELMEMALVENIQREDLNSIEIALAYQNLIDSLSITQEQLSERVGKKRATITNYLRLLKLPAEVQMGVKDKKIDMGHARALIAIENPVEQLRVYNKIVNEGLSVRKVESLVKDIASGESINDNRNSNKKSKSLKEDNLYPDFELLANHLSNYFKSPVQFTCDKKGKGKITIPFTSSEDLTRIIAVLDKIKK